MESAASTLFDELHAIFLSLVGGARYGVKIRLPHAIVMTLLFRRDLSAQKKLKSILKLVAEHGANLATFAFLYKAILALLKWTSRHCLPQRNGGSGTSQQRNGLFRTLGRFLSMLGKPKLLTSALLWFLIACSQILFSMLRQQSMGPFRVKQGCC